MEEEQKEALSIREWVVSEKPQTALKALALTGIETMQYSRMLVASMNANPGLAKCTPTSIMLALGACVMTGLQPNTPLGEAYIIPYKDQAQFQAGFRGLQKLARRSGIITNIEARVVHVDDEFDYQLGTEQALIHKPGHKTVKQEKDLKAAWSAAFFKDGSRPSFEVIWADELTAIRKMSKAPSSPAWVGFLNEMCRKTAFKRHSKWLTMDDVFARAVQLDNASAMGEDLGDIIDVDPEGTAGAPVKVSRRLEKENL